MAKLQNLGGKTMDSSALLLVGIPLALFMGYIYDLGFREGEKSAIYRAKRIFDEEESNDQVG